MSHTRRKTHSDDVVFGTTLSLLLTMGTDAKMLANLQTQNTSNHQNDIRTRNAEQQEAANLRNREIKQQTKQSSREQHSAPSTRRYR